MPQRVLIVDDDAALAENLADIVGGLGVETETAEDGKQALALAERGDFDLALVDLRLPDGDGVALIDPLRERSPLTEVVLITGDATVESAIAAVRGGAFAFVLKPFSPPDLIETVKRGLAQVAGQRERERLRAELERSERRHRQVVDAAPAFVLALDAEGRIAVWNSRLEEVTGRPRGEMIGTSGTALVAGEGDRPLPIKSGGHRLVRWRLAHVHAPEGALEWTYAIGIDVTAEQEMMRRTLRAERLAAVGIMAAGLAHEIRNPLNSALLQIALLEKKLARGDVSAEAIGQVCGLVKDEIGRLDRLVGDFLAFVRPRPLELHATDLGGLCRAVLELCGPELERGRVTVHTELAASLAPASADPEQLRQVLLNLIRNAIEAMADGGTLTLRTREAGTDVELDVEDTGHGFPEEAPVFDAFFTTKSGGTGLGLSIVHRIVSDHGGSIRVRSRPGSTCFTITVPAAAGG